MNKKAVFAAQVVIILLLSYAIFMAGCGKNPISSVIGGSTGSSSNNVKVGLGRL